MELTSENVQKTIENCFNDETAQSNYENLVWGEGIKTRFGFDKDLLEAQRGNIASMLDELPGEFKATGGGGYSFLNMCVDKHGNQWADTHNKMESLLCVGLALGLLDYCLPREMWYVLPGGMPYVVVKTPDTKEKQLYWGYKHTSGTYHAKRYTDSRDVTDAEQSDFCAQVVKPFLAANRDEALQIVEQKTN